MQKVVNISNGFDFANNKKLSLIAGPCQMESRDHAFKIAESLKNTCEKLGINLVFKTSFDKANRTSLSGKRGIGLAKATEVFYELKDKLKLPLLTDIHKEEHTKELKGVVDIMQIPAFLCRQTDLLEAAANAGAIVNVKKGQFLAPQDVINIVKKLEHFGCNKILLTERGTSFGYNNLIVDMRGLEVMKNQSLYPIIFDATHSTQSPGGLGGASGGDRDMAFVLARSAVAVGIAGIFAEVHDDPDNAPSDGPCMIKLNDFEGFLKTALSIDNIIKNN